MERSPLFCSVCDGYLDLGEPVVGYGRHAEDGLHTPPRFVHPACRESAGPGDPALIELGERPVRDFVLEYLREQKQASMERA